MFKYMVQSSCINFHILILQCLECSIPFYGKAHKNLEDVSADIVSDICICTGTHMDCVMSNKSQDCLHCPSE